MNNIKISPPSYHRYGKKQNKTTTGITIFTRPAPKTNYQGDRMSGTFMPCVTVNHYSGRLPVSDVVHTGTVGPLEGATRVLVV